MRQSLSGISGDAPTGTRHEIDIDALRPFCREVKFPPDAALAVAGSLQLDMYILVSGEASVALPGATTFVVRGAGSPIGEIGFLRGCPASATVRARTALTALAIDNASLAQIERDSPDLAATFLRCLAKIAEARINENVTFRAGRAAPRPKGAAIYLCRDETLLSKAQHLRYLVYCEELGRQSPHADHATRRLVDPLDRWGHVLVALDGDKPVGTLRGNFAGEGDLGPLVDLYGMRGSPNFPAAAGVVTKFVIAKPFRGSSLAFELISALTRLGLHRGILDCYIDSIPVLIPYYRALGFVATAPEFYHRENGPSVPMRVDLARHGRALARPPSVARLARFFLRSKAYKIASRWSSRRHAT